ncbi:MAG: murein biosynthesis integral membrane protein MurJ [Peptostreptococcaceae bacterium]|nr:murein biosynthesis integral membrane protein MurJ [Peptostreptococcaceae bacterium]
MKKTALIILCITLISKILGFGREVILSYFYGASPISDAYFVAVTVPAILLEFLGIAIATSYIPMMSRISHEEGMESAQRYTVNLINHVLLFVMIVFVLAELLAPFIVKLLAVGFEGDLLEITVKFSRVMLSSIFVLGLLNIFGGYLQLQGNYLIPAMMGLPLNIITILSIYLAARSNDHVLIIGTALAQFSQMFFMLPWVWKSGLKYRRSLDLKDERIRATIWIALPVILGASVNQINLLVDKTIASTIVVGGISALNYAGKLNLFIQGVFVVSITTVLFPRIAKMAEEKNIQGIREGISESFAMIDLLVIPITIGALIFSKEIVAVLFGRGAFDENALLLTSSALFFYSIGMIGFGYREVLSKAFYSMHDTKTPVVNATIGVGINIILNLVLSRFMGLGGLALATSISALVTAALMMGSLRKKLGKLDIWSIDVAKILLASVVMGGCAKMTFDLLSVGGGMFSSLVLAVLCGVVVYVILGLLLKIEEAVKLKNIVVARLKR